MKISDFYTKYAIKNIYCDTVMTLASKNENLQEKFYSFNDDISDTNIISKF